MNYVVDTSVAVKWVIPESGVGIEADTDRALELIGQHGLSAPDCIIGEFANALFKKVQMSEIATEQALAAFAILPETVRFFTSAQLVEAALALALEIKHPVHDCIFLVAAMHRNEVLITADRKFYSKCISVGKSFPVQLLGEIA